MSTYLMLNTSTCFDYVEILRKEKEWLQFCSLSFALPLPAFTLTERIRNGKFGIIKKIYFEVDTFWTFLKILLITI